MFPGNKNGKGPASPLLGHNGADERMSAFWGKVDLAYCTADVRF